MRMGESLSPRSTAAGCSHPVLACHSEEHSDEESALGEAPGQIPRFARDDKKERKLAGFYVYVRSDITEFTVAFSPAPRFPLSQRENSPAASIPSVSPRRSRSRAVRVPGRLCG